MSVARWGIFWLNGGRWGSILARWGSVGIYFGSACGDGWGLVGMSGGRWGIFLAWWGSVGMGARFSKA